MAVSFNLSYLRLCSNKALYLGMNDVLTMIIGEYNPQVQFIFKLQCFALRVKYS